MAESLNELWNTWGIQVLVMSSLFLQIFLLAFASLRKRVVPIRMSQSTSFSLRAPLNIVLHWLLLLSYLSADFVATAALGYLSQYEDSPDSITDGSQNQNKHLIMFWAPFLLLHLGGQDTITALSIEDNELWLRHLLTLISQVVFAIYVYSKSEPGEGGLWPATILMFIAGIEKYAERTWCLRKASIAGLWGSLVSVPEPNRNFAKLIKEYATDVAGLHSHIIFVGGSQKELTADQRKLKKCETKGKLGVEITDEQYSIIVSQAYRFFQMFKGLFVDILVDCDNLEETKTFFKELKNEVAYKVIEIELLLIYQKLHTKADLLQSWYGRAFRVVALVCTLISLCIFTVHSKRGFRQIEIVVTYILLAGAIVLELVSLFCMLVSIWTFAALIEGASNNKLGKTLFSFVKKLWPPHRSLWSNRMGQYNLVNFAGRDKPNLLSKIMKFICVKGNWDNYGYTTYVPVDENLRILVLKELKSKMNMSVSDHRGQWILLHKGHSELGWSMEHEFEKCILIWHVATDLLFDTDTRCAQNTQIELNCKVGQHISNYMMFLLIQRPFMLPVGIGEIRFLLTRSEARNFFMRRRRPDNAKASPEEMLLRINTDYDRSATREQHNLESVLFDGCKLAHQLRDKFGENSNAMWELINAVWVEMLCFAANKCSGQFHAKQMSKGGEFLTFVWMLMAHLGLGDQCKLELHPSVKLVIEK